MKILKALLPTLAAVIFAVSISHADFFYRWSQTAGSNANSDTFTWAEGQAPSTVNDSARGMMAALAKFRDDTSGKLVTTGTATAYALTTNSVFNTLAAMDGALLAFRMNVTSGAAPTLNVDGLGAKALNQATGIAVATGALISGAVYSAVYVNASNEWIVQGIAGAVPSGTVMVAAQTTCPTGWTKGATHNDKALRVVTGTASSGGTNAFSTVMAQTATAGFTLLQGHLPSYTLPDTLSISDAGHVHILGDILTSGSTQGAQSGGGATILTSLSSGNATNLGSANISRTGNVTSGGSNTAHAHAITMAMQYVDVILCTKN
jgi:hypothetical protein